MPGPGRRPVTSSSVCCASSAQIPRHAAEARLARGFRFRVHSDACCSDVQRRRGGVAWPGGCDGALQGLPGVRGACARVTRLKAGHQGVQFSLLGDHRRRRARLLLGVLARLVQLLLGKLDLVLKRLLVVLLLARQAELGRPSLGLAGHNVLLRHAAALSDDRLARASSAERVRLRREASVSAREPRQEGESLPHLGAGARRSCGGRAARAARREAQLGTSGGHFVSHTDRRGA